MSSFSRPHRLLPLALLALGTTVVTIAWVVLALQQGRQCSWMALLAAVDAAILLRLGGWRPGRSRSLVAIAGVAIAIAAANWGIAALQIGLPMGLGWIESLGKLGPYHGWTLLQLANSPTDLLWLGAGLAAAGWLSR